MKLLVACDPNGGIGYKKKLPWTNLRGDLQRFKQLTENQVIVMGRHTWESLPKKPLILDTKSKDILSHIAYRMQINRLPKSKLIINLSRK